MIPTHFQDTLRHCARLTGYTKLLALLTPYDINSVERLFVLHSGSLNIDQSYCSLDLCPLLVSHPVPYLFSLMNSIVFNSLVSQAWWSNRAKITLGIKKFLYTHHHPTGQRSPLESTHNLWTEIVLIKAISILKKCFFKMRHLK